MQTLRTTGGRESDVEGNSGRGAGGSGRPFEGSGVVVRICPNSFALSLCFGVTP